MAAVSMMSYPVRDAFHGYPQQYAMYQTRAHHPEHEMAQSINHHPYPNYGPVSHPQQYQQHQQQPVSRSSQRSNSPVLEDGSRPSLPSISNLLGIADGDRPGQEAGTSGNRTLYFVTITNNLEATQQAQLQAPQEQQHSQLAEQPTQTIVPEQRQPLLYPAHELSSTHRPAIPPTPPLRNDSVVEGTNSPSTISTGSSLSLVQPPQPYVLGSAINNVEASEQRVGAPFIKRPSVPSQPPISPYVAHQYGSPYAHSPSAVSNGSFYSPTDAAYPTSAGLYHQRPLPSNFPPQPPPAPFDGAKPPLIAGGIPLQQHHHYISPSSQAAFPQSQDRYICQTCNKAFSRPSSLKIHSHSHTGEKPFKCPHVGCGKAFSVRSNMKRHERGCHPGGGAIPSSHLV